MNILCPACGRTIDVPDYWAAKPPLRVKCPCGSAVRLGAAHRVVASASPPPACASVAAVAPAGPVAATTAPVPVAATPVSVAPVAAAQPAVDTERTPARPRWAAPPPATQTAGASPVSAAPASPRAPLRVHWRRCANHPSTPSTTVCPTCRRGYCQSCEKRVQNAMVCPTCSNLCLAADDYANLEEGERRRARSLVDDLGTIVGYPLRDPLGFVVLAVFIVRCAGDRLHARAGGLQASAPARAGLT